MHRHSLHILACIQRLIMALQSFIFWQSIYIQLEVSVSYIKLSDVGRKYDFLLYSNYFLHSTRPFTWVVASFYFSTRSWLDHRRGFHQPSQCPLTSVDMQACLATRIKVTDKILSPSGLKLTFQNGRKGLERWKETIKYVSANCYDRCIAKGANNNFLHCQLWFICARL